MLAAQVTGIQVIGARLAVGVSWLGSMLTQERKGVWAVRNTKKGFDFETFVYGFN